MIIGMHALIYSADADALRAFLRDTLGFPFVDAGHGWLIFGVPAAEVGVHPVEQPATASRSANIQSPDSGPDPGYCSLSLMCDEINGTVAELKSKGVRFRGEIDARRYGLVATMHLPGGGLMDLYEPRHPTALGLKVPATKPAE